MKKFLALLVSAVLLFGLLASFPSAGSGESGYGENENSVGNESSVDETPGGDGEETPEFFNNVLNLIKRVVDKDGKPYNGDPDREFTIHVTGSREYNRMVKLKANATVSLTDLPAGSFEIREEIAEDYTRIDESNTITFTASEVDRYFPDDVTATLGNKRDGSPVDAGRSSEAVALTDEGGIPFPDGTFLSLGIGGVAIFEFDKPFYNGPYEDVGVWEVTWYIQDESYEYARVDASKDGTDGWETLGYITGYSNGNNGQACLFDLEDLDWARYIRITDLSEEMYFKKALVSNTTDGSALSNTAEVPNTTGEGAGYRDPDDGIDIDYVYTRYQGEVKNLEIVNRHETQDNPSEPPGPGQTPTTTSLSEPSEEYFTLTTAVSGQGSILPGPGNTSHAKGSKVQLKPEPAAGWEFDRWTGDAVNELNQIYMDGNKSVTAVFRQIPDELPALTGPASEAPAPVEVEEQSPPEGGSPAVDTIVDEELPAALPKTGGIPALIFIGTGSALILAGIAAGMKRR